MKKSILFAVLIFFSILNSKAQSIPNAGFETWATMSGYNNPDSWSTLNDITTPMSTYTCLKGTPGNPGTSYIKLISKTVTGMGVMKGIAVSGIIDTTTMQAISGFPFSQRPSSMTGKWQHMIYGSSQGYIDIQLTRWDTQTQTRITVASKHQVLSGMAMSWAAFSISLVYTDGNNPDSCIITLSASGNTPTNNDYLWVDNLAFVGTVTGIAQNKLDVAISLYPNPTTNKLSMDLSSLRDKFVNIEVTDIQGKLVKSYSAIDVSPNTSITVSDIPNGNYILNIIANEGTIQKNFIKK